MLRRIAISLILLCQAFCSSGQVYFDGIYIDDGRGEGVNVGGTVKLSDVYLNWSNGSFAGPLYTQLSLIAVDFEGEFVFSSDFALVDTIREKCANIIALNDTEFVALSFEQVFTEDAPGDAVLRKFNRNADVEWKHVYGDPNRLDIPQRFGMSSDGGFSLTGQVTFDDGNDEQADVWLVKTDQNGIVEWEQTYGGANYENGADVIQTPDNGYLILGWTRTYGIGQRDFYLVKTNDQGDEQWYETYGTSADEIGKSILTLTDGNYLLTGSGTNPQLTESLGRLYKIDSDGNEIWSESYMYNNNTGHNFHKTIEMWNGDLVSVGMTNLNSNAGWLVRTNSLGEILWQREYDKNSQTDLFTNVIATDDGGFLLSGQAINEQTNSQDAWLLKVDSVGCTFPNCITGIDQVEKTIVVDVWPNPTTDVLNLDFSASQAPLEMMVYDVSGKEILRFSQNSNQESIDVSGWSSGVYVLQGSNEDGRSFSLKVVKE